MTSGVTKLNFTLFFSSLYSWLCCLKYSLESLGFFSVFFLCLNEFLDAWIFRIPEYYRIIIIIIIMIQFWYHPAGFFWSLWGSCKWSGKWLSTRAWCERTRLNGWKTGAKSPTDLRSLMIWTRLFCSWCGMNYMQHTWYRAKTCLTMILRLNQHDFTWSFTTWDLFSLTYWVFVGVHLKECNFQGTGLKL